LRRLHAQLLGGAKMSDGLGFSAVSLMQESQIVMSIGERGIARKSFTVSHRRLGRMMHFFHKNSEVKVRERVIRRIS
jgi:hypothetical protein